MPASSWARQGLESYCRCASARGRVPKSAPHAGHRELMQKRRPGAPMPCLRSRCAAKPHPPRQCWPQMSHWTGS
eukprot:13098688-Alexandrium_andersonii.AAC.1